MERVFVPKSPHEKALQRALIQYRDPKNHDLVMEALRKAGRADLIGFGPKCLIRPYKGEGGHGAGAKKGVAGAKNAMRGPKGREGGQGSGGRGASGRPWRGWCRQAWPRRGRLRRKRSRYGWCRHAPPRRGRRCERRQARRLPERRARRQRRWSPWESAPTLAESQHIP